MIYPQDRRTLGMALQGALIGCVLSAVSLPGAAQRSNATRAKAAASFAQTLVNEALSVHPEADEIGIAVQSPRGCTVVASSDKSDVGEACETDDSAPIRTGKTSVGKEAGQFDVATPLHDKTGALVGALTVRFKKAAGQDDAGVTRQAEAIARDMAARIASKAALLGG